MKFNIGGEASFFKVLRHDSEEYLSIPAAFAKKYMEKTDIKKQEVVLKTNSTAKYWSVNYFKVEEGYYFIDGWLKFIKDNRLQIHDFIVFWLLPSSSSSSELITFQVFPYAPNGCLKIKYTTTRTSHNAAAARRRKNPPAPVKEETSDINYSSQNKQPSTMSVVVKKSYTHQLPLRFLEGKGVGGYQSVRLKNDEEKIWELAIKKQGQEPKPWLFGGWCEFIKSNNINIGNTCEFRHVEDNLFHVRVIKKSKGGRRRVVESKSNCTT